MQLEQVIDPFAPVTIVLKIKLTKELRIYVDSRRAIYLVQKLPKANERMIYLGACNHEDPNDLKDYVKQLLEGAPLNTKLN